MAEASMEMLKERRGTPQTGNGATRSLMGRSVGWPQINRTD